MPSAFINIIPSNIKHNPIKDILIIGFLNLHRVSLFGSVPSNINNDIPINSIPISIEKANPTGPERNTKIRRNENNITNSTFIKVFILIIPIFII
jgi:hypothetical protein